MDDISKQLQSVIEVKNLSKVGRLLHNPIKYFNAMYARFVYYPLTKKGKLTRTETFFGDPMNILLPAATDIYLTSGKSHDSEIRLSSFMIDRLEEGDIYVDVGAHFGFFSLLASCLVGPGGKVLTFEGGEDTYKVLHQNIKAKANIECVNKVVSDTQGQVHFYQFPTAYSEYNSLDIDQYRDTDWIKDNPPKATPMDSVRLSNELVELQVSIIKIDVEGGELGVLHGLEEYLEKENPIIIIEYLSSARNNQTHVLAAQYLLEKGYSSHIIQSSGTIAKCDDLEQYMSVANLDSDNIVFVR